MLRSEEQKEMQIGFFESRLRAETFDAPIGYGDPSSARLDPLEVASMTSTAEPSIDRRAEAQALRFEAETTPMAAPRSAAVDERFSGALEQQRDIAQYVSGSADDVALQTAITNGEAHIQRYGLRSYVDWVGGEDNARIVLGDDRYDQFAVIEAEKATEDRTLRSAK